MLEVVRVKILYMATTGTSDATKASIPFHIAVNGSVEVGQQAQIVLAGDASELIKEGVADSVEGVGIPALRDLLAKARQHEVPVFV